MKNRRLEEKHIDSQLAAEQFSFITSRAFTDINRFANLAAPWMILVFIAAAFAVMPELGINSTGNFWEVANSKIWTGVPLEGQSKFTFWHIMFFAWFANMAMHIGMADLSIFRYAKKWQYGFSSAAGMYLGHYIAWIASGILYSLFLLLWAWVWHSIDSWVRPHYLQYCLW